MTTALNISASESGVIRTFALSLTDAEAEALADDGNPPFDPHPQQSFLGAQSLDRKYVEIFPVANLEGVGLTNYLVEGHGAQSVKVEPDRARLNALQGWVMLVFSGAFNGQSQTLQPDARLTLIGSYPQEGTDWTPSTLTAASAQPNPDAAVPDAPKRMSDARMSGMVATAVLLFLAVFVTIFVLIGG